MSPLTDLQELLLPAAAGTVLVVGSTVQSILTMSAVRYKTKDFEHPYKPWKEDNDMHLRAYKAYQNCIEWAVLTIPLVWVYSLYTPAIPYVGEHLTKATLPLSLAYSFFNLRYPPAYIKSTEDRLAPFRYRTMAVRGLLYGSIAGLGCAGLTSFGLLNL